MITRPFIRHLPREAHTKGADCKAHPKAARAPHGQAPTQHGDSSAANVRGTAAGQRAKSFLTATQASPAAQQRGWLALSGRAVWRDDAPPPAAWRAVRERAAVLRDSEVHQPCADGANGRIAVRPERRNAAPQRGKLEWKTVQQSASPRCLRRTKHDVTQIAPAAQSAVVSEHKPGGRQRDARRRCAAAGYAPPAADGAAAHHAASF